MNARVKTIAWTSCLAGSCAAVLVLYFCDPASVAIYPACLFHRLTGLECPGCGSLRALHELLHGDLPGALRFNPLLVVSLPIFAWLGWRFVRREIKGGPTVSVRPFLVWSFVAVWIAFGILRNLRFPLFVAFAPS
jgi:hypothetical protein